jgi:DNA-binding transcriptional LysR family regulator
MSESAYSLERFSGAEQGVVEGDVIIAAPHVFMGNLIAPNIGSFYKQYPHIRLSLTGTKERLSLARREADITLGMVRPVESAVVTMRLGQVNFTLYGSAEYLASGQNPGIIAYDDSVTATPQQSWLKKHCSGYSVVFFSNDLRIQAITAAGNAGIALLPDYLAKEYHLVPVQPGGPALTQDIWMSVHRDVRHASHIRPVIDFLKSCIEPAYG